MPPTNDAFASATVLTGTSGSVGFSIVGATSETGEDVSTAAGPETVWFTWTCPASGDYTFDLSSTPLPSWDSYLEAFTGTAVNALTLVASDDDSGLQPGAPGPYGTPRLTIFGATGGTTYRLRVSDYEGGSRSDAVLHWGLYVPPPTLTSTFPTSGVAGTTVVLTGTNLSAVTAVTFTGTAATFTINSSTQITTTVPTLTTASSQVTVTSPGGSATRSFTVLFPGPWIQPDDTEHAFNTTETTYSSTENVGPTDPAPDPAGTPSFGHGGVANGQFVQTNINPDGSLAGWQWQQVISVFGVDLDATVTSGAGLGQVPPDPSSWPPGAVNYEFEAAQGTATGPLRLQVDTSLHAADFNDDNVKTADPTFDVFATESEIRRLDPSSYDFSTTWPTFPGDVWPAQSVLAAATLLAEWVMARTSADITDTFGDGKRLHSEWAPDEWTYDLTVADLDPANTFVAVAALDVHTVGSQWALPYFAASSGAAKDANHALTAQMIVAYRPPRYRFLFNTPPVTTTLEAWAHVEGSVAPGTAIWG